MDDKERAQRIRAYREFAGQMRASASEMRQVHDNTPSSSLAIALDGVIALADDQAREADTTADRLAAGFDG